MVRLLFSLLLAFASLPSPASMVWTYRIFQGSIQSSSTSASSACSAWWASWLAAEPRYSEVAPASLGGSWSAPSSPEEGYQYMTTYTCQGLASPRWPNGSLIYPEGQAISANVYATASPLVCPAGFVVSGSECVPEPCPEGQSRVNGTCQPPNDCRFDRVISSSTALSLAPANWGASSTSLCMSGCRVAPQYVYQYEGEWFLRGPYMAQGVACTGSESGDGSGLEGAPTQCQRGQCPYNMNGTWICTACSGSKSTETSSSSGGDGTTTTKESTTQNTVLPDGQVTTSTTTQQGTTTTQTTTMTQPPEGISAPHDPGDTTVTVTQQPGGKILTTEVTKNADGTYTVKETTKSITGLETVNCMGDRCESTKTTTTVTGTDPGTGQPVTTTTTTQATSSKNDFCSANPSHPQCKGDGRDGSGVFSGGCDAGFTCEGDAVQCAMARKQHQLACDLTAPNDYTAILAGLESNVAQPTGHPGLEPELFDLNLSSRLDASSSISGSCPSNVSFSVWGKALVVPLSDICPQLQLLGSVVLAFAYMAAAFIVFRRS